MKSCQECTILVDEAAATCPSCGGASWGPAGDLPGLAKTYGDTIERDAARAAESLAMVEPSRKGKKSKRADTIAPPPPDPDPTEEPT